MAGTCSPIRGGPGTPDSPGTPDGPGMMDTQTTSCTAATTVTMESMESEEFDQYGNVVSVGDITFLDENLGSGAYATVRLARRRVSSPPPPPSSPSPPPGGCKRSHPTSASTSASALPTIAASQDEGDAPATDAAASAAASASASATATAPQQVDDDTGAGGYLGIGRFGKRIARAALSPWSSFMTTDSSDAGSDGGDGDGASDCFDTAVSSSDGYLSSSQCSSLHSRKGGGGGDEQGELVAVKCFSKSLLKRMRTMERSSLTRKVMVHTALERVEREIALMKMMRHPNIVSMLEVIDSQDGDALYMVLEYMPRGEIMTFDEDEGTFSRVDRPGEPPLKGVVDGHFDEKTAALYFVDVLHGLAYLHQNGICHRDLKPENILLDAKGQVKIGDFGVSHFFEDEKDRYGATRLWNRSESSVVRNSYHPSILSRMDTDSALAMKGMSNRGMLKRTEGTWCFWAPEMCSEVSGPFSGYAADIWSAGVCLYIFVTGRLPFYSDVPTELFDLIAGADVPYDPAEMSPQLMSLLRMLLEKDPEKRAGLGDCLKHPFLAAAREQRVKDLSSELRQSSRKLVVSEEDVRKAFKRVSAHSAAAVIRSAAIFKQRLDSARNLIKKESGMSRASSLVSSLPPSRGSPVSTCMEDDRSADFASQKSNSTVSDPPEMMDTEQSSLSIHERGGADDNPSPDTGETDDEGMTTQFCRVQ